MPTEVIMPKVDMDMERGTITAWLVVEGAFVTTADPLFEIETDKAAMEVESPADGVLRHIVADVGSEVAIGQPVAWIYADGEPFHEPPATSGGVVAAETSVNPAPTDAPGNSKHEVTDASDGRLRATPAARRLAKGTGAQLDTIAGTGPRGRIQSRDIEEAVRSNAAASVKSPGNRLSVTTNGRGTGLPVLLIHGLGSDTLGWAPLKAGLPKNSQIHSVDLPAHGKSPAFPVGSFADLVSCLRATIDEHVDSQVHLVGHSLGGALALAIADTRPRLVADLTLISPAGLGPDINGTALSGVLRASRAESLAPWLKKFVNNPDLVSENYVQSVLAQRSDPGKRAAQTQLAESLFPDSTQSLDLIAALHRLDCTSRIIWGRKDDIIPWRHSLRAPGRTALHLFDSTGHLPHIERPKDVAALITAAIGS